jgi:UDP:flavonoid glycosyltransferase YjiC (YdhE family)
MMGRRGVLLAPTRDLVPEDLPETLRYFDYVPLSALLPRAAAIVHHGGIGTTALALAAGVPQLVAPFADDQSDNAARVQRVNAGLMMTRADYRPKTVARKLAHLLESKEIALACRSAAERIRQQRPLPEACRLIEELAARAPWPPSR